MKDASLSFSKALPNAAANNNTDSIDLGSAASPFKSDWRNAHFAVGVPALSDHTNTSVTTLLTLQDSANNVTFADTDPLIQIKVTGKASTGSLAKSVAVPLPPGIRQYVRFNQNAPANAGVANNAAVTYDLVV